MKHTPERNAAILNHHARTMQTDDSVDETVEQLRNMFAQRSIQTKDDRKHRGDRENTDAETHMHGLKAGPVTGKKHSSATLLRKKLKGHLVRKLQEI